MSAFEELGLCPELIAAASGVGWELPREIQADAIPGILGGADVFLAAETGSGKTAAFTLPVLQAVHEELLAQRSTGKGLAAGSYDQVKSKREDDDTINGSESPGKRRRMDSASEADDAMDGSESPGKRRRMNDASSADGTSENLLQLNVHDCDRVLRVDRQHQVVTTKDGGKWGGVRTTHGIPLDDVFLSNSYGYYYECEITGDGIPRVGWATKRARREIGTDQLSWGYGGTAKGSHGRRFTDYGVKYGKGDTVGIILAPLKTQTKGPSKEKGIAVIAFCVNGQNMGPAFTVSERFQGHVIYPAVCTKGGSFKMRYGHTEKYAEQYSFAVKAIAEGSQAKAINEAASLSTEERVNRLQKVDSMDIVEDRAKPGYTKAGPMALILEPSKELANQVVEHLDQFGTYFQDGESKPPRTLGVIGGVPVQQQVKQLKKGGIDIVVSTPGRLEQFVSSGQLSLKSIRFLIIDEADGMLNAGHGKFIRQMVAQIPPFQDDGTRLQIIACSATLHNPAIIRLSEELCEDPLWVDQKGMDSIPDTVQIFNVKLDPIDHGKAGPAEAYVEGQGAENRLLVCANEHYKCVCPNDKVHTEHDTSEFKDARLSRTIKLVKPAMLLNIIERFKMESVMIFVRTRIDADNLEAYFRMVRQAGGKGSAPNLGVPEVVVLSGERDAGQRQRNLDLFKNGDARILIATDVAARGIDIQGLPYIINMTLPDKPEEFMHRVGRVGRAGQTGIAINIVSAVPEKVWFHRCPSRGKQCNNRKLLNMGGCTIWYDEMKILQEIENKLGSCGTFLDDKLDMSMHVKEAGTSGDSAGSATRSRYRQYVVEALTNMERSVQLTFLRSTYGSGNTQ
eukprot:Clim_evm96s236 gene=Clim_evmTU96s236